MTVHPGLGVRLQGGALTRKRTFLGRVGRVWWDPEQGGGEAPPLAKPDGTTWSTRPRTASLSPVRRTR